MLLETSSAYSIAEVRSILRAACFAATRHAAQRRKSEDQEPYINHLIEVAEILAATAPEPDAGLIMAGFLHDTIEDVRVTREELEAEFGADVAGLVVEVTDDKTLDKPTRKALQIASGPAKSRRAQSLGAADKIANLRSILEKPPAGWNLERRLEYFHWARQVVDAFPALNPVLAARFNAVYARLGEMQ